MTKQEREREKKNIYIYIYILKKVMLKTEATLKTMEKLFAKTMAVFVFLLAQSQNRNSILHTTSC